MKRQQNTPLSASILAVCLSAMGAMPAAAVIDTTFNAGDWILGVQSSSSTAFVLEVNVGAALQYKSATSSFLVGNIGSQLTTQFGNTWYDEPNLFLGVSGARSNTAVAGSADANGDFNSTVYATRARTANGLFTSPNSAPWSIAPASATSAASAMIQLGNTFSANNVNGIGAIGSGIANTWEDFNLVSGSNQGSAYSSVFAGGIQYNFGPSVFDTGNYAGLTNVEGVVDMYRIARFADSESTPGAGKFLGSFAIERDGDVFFVPTPEPGSVALLAVGLVSLAGSRFRKHTEA